MATRSRKVRVFERPWRYAEPFVISRGTITRADALEVQIVDSEGLCGHGESLPLDYAGETLVEMRSAIVRTTAAIESGAGRDELLQLLPPGGARCALDAALWDLEAKKGGTDPFVAQGVQAHAVHTAYTIGIRASADYTSAARALAGNPWLKIKLDRHDPLLSLEHVVRGAPYSKLIVDPNQAWTIDELKALAPRLVSLNVALIEQPIPTGHEAGLDGYTCPIPICADECFDGAEDLPRVVGRFQVVNIKLEKAGGLTAAMQLAKLSQAAGLELMVGCMGGSSLAMAPGMVLAQSCRYVDLDGPRMLAEDCPNGFTFTHGIIAQPHIPTLWG